MATLRVRNKSLSFNNIFYVDTINGSDVNDGTLYSPFASMTKAISRTSQFGDAIYLKGEDSSDSDYGNKTVSVFGNYLTHGSKLTGRQHGSNTSLMATVTYYGIYILGTGVTGWSEDFFYINATLYNCIFLDRSPYSNVYGVYNYYNCLILGMASPYSATTFTNCAFTGAQLASSIKCLSNVTCDSLYNITSSGWQGAGTGFNIDGSPANVGLYGGLYECFGNVFSEYKILIPPMSNNYSSGTYSWLTKSNLNKSVVLYGIGFVCGRTYASGTTGLASARIYDSNFQLIARGSVINTNMNSFTYSMLDMPITLIKNKIYYIGLYGYRFATYSEGDNLYTLSDGNLTIYYGSTAYGTNDSYGPYTSSAQAEMSFMYDDVYENDNSNFQHYAIRVNNKFYIPNKVHFDITKNKFTEITLPELYNFNNNLEYYITNVENIYTHFIANNKVIYPLDYIGTNSSIVKITGNSYYHYTLNNLYSKITFKTDFTKAFKSTLVKLKDTIKLPLQELRYFLSSNNKVPIRVGLVCNSYVYGEGFKIIDEADIQTKGINLSELDKLDIPFDNVRIMFCFTRNIGADDDELRYFKIIKDNNNLRKLLNYNEHTLISKQDNDNIYITVNNATETLIVNKLEKENMEYRVKDTLNTF